jgi:hypothetical protein
MKDGVPAFVVNDTAVSVTDIIFLSFRVILLRRIFLALISKKNTQARFYECQFSLFDSIGICENIVPYIEQRTYIYCPMTRDV